MTHSPFSLILLSFRLCGGVLPLTVLLLGLPSGAARGEEPDITAPTEASVFPIPNSVVRTLGQVEVAFSEPVTGVTALDLVINGTPATNVWMSAPAQFVFEFAQPAAGLTTVTWTDHHHITDLAQPPNRFAGGTWTYVLDTNTPGGGVIINEFLAVNSTGLRDEDGDRPDWIELRNTNALPVSLEGWFLTDDAMNLTRWRFPNVTLDPDTYLVVFASGKDRTNDLNRLHANFQLSSRGEFLALVNARTNIVSSFAPSYPAQQADVSYGRDRLSPELVGSFVTPTPGAPNTDVGPGFAPEVHFSVEGGTFVSPFPLYLSTPDPEAVIHYVVVIGSGSPGVTNVPTTASPIYANPIPITSAVQVRARAFKPGYLPGPPHTETYIPLRPEALTFSSDLPILLIHNLGQGAVPTSGDQSAYVAIFDRDKKTGRATLTSRPVVSSRVGLNIRGRGSQGYPKSGFAVEFWDEYNQDKNVEVLGMPAESDWVLYGTLDTDPVHIHNPLAREMSNVLGRQASRTRFVEVFLNTAGGPINYVNPTNGHYNGIYVVIEKIKRSEGRVNVASLDPQDTAPDTITGGYMFKSDDPPETDEFTFVGARQQIIMVYPGKRNMAQTQRAPQLSYMRSYFNSFSNSLYGPNWTNATGYAQYIDVDSWIDHSIVSVATFNVDAIRLSGYFYKDRNKPLEMGPIWDCDRSLGSIDGRQINPRFWRGQGGDQGTDYFNSPGPGPSHFWYGQLFRDINFWQRYIDRYQAARRGPYALTNLYSIIDRMIAEITQAQPREQAKWGHLAPPRNANGNGPGTFSTEVMWLKTWLANRLDFMDTNFLGQPVFNTNAGLVPSGFALTLTPPAKPGTQIYFTLDGSDPRAPGGVIASNAMLYNAAIPVTSNTRVVARSYNLNHRNLTGRDNPPLSSPWSGPNAGTFMVQVPPLLITEIMYHPDNPPADDATDPDHFEYVELKNTGAEPLDLVGFRITNGIDFVFTATNTVSRLAPGDYVLIVKDREAFSRRYPGVTNVAGEYQGNLANDGNRLTLLGPREEPILDFRFEDQWYPTTDGSGFSLAVVDENASPVLWGSNTHWRASARWRGSPGHADVPPWTIAPILVNEVLAHSVPPLVDAIELHNPTPEPVNISGWYLTDDFDRPMKYAIPAGTVISAGGYLYFTEADFNAAGNPNGFALNRTGDEVYLFSGDGVNITGYFHGFDFGASDANVSFGRYLTSTGEEQFVPQATNTLGLPNAGPRVGPIVVRQILSEPLEGLFGSNHVENSLQEYVELHNVTDAPVPLYDTANPTYTWQVTGGVDFTFPPGVVVPPHRSVVLVRFDPHLDPYQLERFRLQSGFLSDVPLYGPFLGRLGNEDDEINVRSPGLPIAPPASDAGRVPYIRVEHIQYSARSPWPTNASGGTAALRRLSLTGYGNDPTNWTSVPILRPVIDRPPLSQVGAPGSSPTFSVMAHGAGPLTYQWRFNGVAISDATNVTFTLNNAQAEQAGFYDVRVTDGNGSVLTPLATLTLIISPLIVQHPQGTFVLLGADLNLAIAVTNTATLPINYRWRRGSSVIGSVLLEARSATLTIPRIQGGQAGAYSVVVSNAALAQSTGMVSRVAPVVVVVPPSNVVATAGSNVTLRSSVGNGLNNPVWLQWSFNGALLPQETNATVTVTNVQVNNEGPYTLYVTNSLKATAAYQAGLGLITPIVLADPTWQPEGTFRAHLQGIAWQKYQVQFSTNLTNWLPLATLSYTNGPIAVVDPSASNALPRFYRARLAP